MDKKMPQTVMKGGSNGTTLVKSMGPDRGSMNKASTESLSPKMGGSRTDLSKTMKV